MKPFDPADLSEEYPYRLRITKAGTAPGDPSETQDHGTGLPTDPAGGTPTTIVVLDCPADAQDGGEQRPRSAAGMPWLQSDVTFYIPEDEDLVEAFLAVEANSAFELYYLPSDRVATGEILQTREMDTSLLGKFR